MSKSNKKPLLILASASKGRLELLRSIGLEPDIIAPADIDETPQKNELPSDFVKRISQEKALTIQKTHPNSFIIAADTIASCGRRIIGKVDNENDARKTLELLSGRRHKVITGICIINPEGTIKNRVITTTVKFKRLEKKELDRYLKSEEWRGKSGCYGMQTHAGGFIISINGSFSNVIGLPLVETKNMLLGLGFSEDR